MLTIPKSSFIYTFSNANHPVARIRDGETLRLETMDNLSDMIKKDGMLLIDVDFDKEKVNPATGPIYIENLMSGDVLEISILNIELEEHALVMCQAGIGVIGRYFDETTIKVMPIRDGYAVFDEKLSIPLKPMVGVMGVTPAATEQPTYMLGSFGGNMDNIMVTEGSTLYLPVEVEGGLFAAGDMHAAMGDGEINCTGLEVGGAITLRFGIRRDISIKNPVLTNSCYFSTIAAGDTLDDAANTATDDMAMLFKERLPLPFDKISMLMSAVGNLEVCQVVNPKKSARFCMPNYVLDTYNFHF